MPPFTGKEVKVTVSPGQNGLLSASIVTLTGLLTLLVIVTWSKLGVQVPLLIVHLNTLSPAPILVILVVPLVALVIVPVPLIKVHKPVPVTGVLPAINVESVHTDWSGPAFAVVGAGVTVVAIMFDVLLHPAAVITTV